MEKYAALWHDTNIWTQMAPLLLLVFKKKHTIFQRLELWVLFQYSFAFLLRTKIKAEDVVTVVNKAVTKLNSHVMDKQLVHCIFPRSYKIRCRCYYRVSCSQAVGVQCCVLKYQSAVIFTNICPDLSQ